MFQKACKVINILLLVITRKVDPKSKLLFTDKFIENFQYNFSQSEVCHFFNFFSKTTISGIIWQVQGNRPIPFSSYQQDGPKINFRNPDPMTREFIMKARHNGITAAEKSHLVQSSLEGCMQYLSTVAYVSDFFQNSVNWIIEKRRLVNQRMANMSHSSFDSV